MSPSPALLRLVLLSALGTGLAGCRSPERGSSPPAGIPTLEDVFGRPGLHGEAPRSAGLSADGQWILMRWRATERDETGQLARSEDPPLRILRTDAAQETEGRGLVLAELLPEAPPEPAPELEGEDPGDEQEEPETEDERAAPSSPTLYTSWSPRGHRLAVGRGSELFLLVAEGSAPDARVIRLAGPDEPEGDEPDGEPGEDPELDEMDEPEPEGPPVFVAWRAEPEPPEELGEIADVRFTEAGDALFVETENASWLWPLPAEVEGSLDPKSARWLDAWVEPHSDAAAEEDDTKDDEEEEEEEEEEESALQFDTRYTTAFRASPPIAHVAPRWALEAGGGELEAPPSGEGDEASERPEVPSRPMDRGASRGVEPLPAQVIDLETGLAVALEGMGGIEWLEDESLSPDGRFVVGLEMDYSNYAEPQIVPDYLTELVTTRETRRARADDGPVPWKLFLWNTTDGAREELEIPGDDEPGWLWTIGWAPQPDSRAPARFAFHRRSADHRRQEIWCWSETGLRLVFRHEDERWVGGPTLAARWTHDGKRMLFTSECTDRSSTPDRSQLFVAELEGTSAPEVRQLTEVTGEVSGFRACEDGSVYFWASNDDPSQRFLGRISASAVRGADLTAEVLGARPGWNDSPIPSRDGSRVVFSHGTLFRPAELWTIDRLRSPHALPLTRTIPEAFEAVDWILPVEFQVTDEQGTAIRAHVYLPRETSIDDPDRPRATVVFIHGAGFLQNVTDSMTSYEVNMMFHSRLAALGYVVVDVDYRGSEGYGNRFRTDVQYHLGGKDLDDIHRVVDALAQWEVIDTERVGVYGGSYGGFLALMALFTAPERWAAGAALRSVTDWRTYNPVYTQPRLGRPSTHEEAYERSSPIDWAEHLEDPLLILHGLVDDNVLAQDSIRLIEKLIDEGLDFDAMLYPSQGHGFSDGAHWIDEYSRIERFLIEHLGAP